MPARHWLILLSYYYRYVIIIILISSSFILFSWPSTSISPHRFVVLLTLKTNDQFIEHSFSNRSVSKQPFPLINRTITIIRNSTVRLAIVSAIYSDDYIESVEVLAYSLRRVRTQADLILLYITNRLNQSLLHRCRRAGWHLWPVDRIKPPQFAIVYPRFYDQYTKLRIWSLVGYDRVIYLDADTLVLREINELLTDTVFENEGDGLLAAVEDVWQGQIGPNFNAGVLVIRPNKTIFDDMLVKMSNMAAYGSYWAEQGFLNWYFKGSTGRLPLIYNFNNVLAIYHRDVYSRLRHRIKIIHYTSDKPFRFNDVHQLSDTSFIELWNQWRQMRNEMLLQSGIF